jgi:hypothetical protein
MFGTFFRFLRPFRLIKRKGVTSGLFGGDRKWLALGGIVFIGSRIKSMFGFGEPAPVYTEVLKPGERVVVAHAEKRRRRKR